MLLFIKEKVIVQQFMRMSFLGQGSFCDVILKLQALLEQLKSSVLLHAAAILVRTSKHFVLVCETFHMAIYMHAKYCRKIYKIDVQRLLLDQFEQSLIYTTIQI